MAVKWKKHLISKESTYEACSVFDVDNDGIPDIVCGAYWYQGPDFKQKHFIWDIMPVEEYFDDFSNYPMDVNGDGCMDIITGAYWSGTLRWLENPGPEAARRGEPWKVHDICKTGAIETTRFYDIDGCGTAEIFPNTPGDPQRMFKLVKKDGKGTGEFKEYVLYDDVSNHGIGFADVEGNGRMDVILCDGWLECPEDPFQTPWAFHPEYKIHWGNCPMLGYDVNGNGKTDIIASNAHGFGLYWLEQAFDTVGKRVWKRHEIDPDGAQYHDMMLADVDGDGVEELVTGKRWRAHCGGDPGDNDPCFVYVYKIKDGKIDRQTLDFGLAEDGHTGVGIYLWVADVFGNGRMDIVCPGKEGLYVFENLGNE